MKTHKSPLHDHFSAAGATFETRAGWQVPSVCGDEEREYFAIRTGVGISDLSDIGKLRIKGEGARALLDELVTGNVERIVENSILWTAIVNERGRVVGDIQIYNDFDDYLVTCEGSLRTAVLDELRQHGRDDVKIEDLTENLAAVSVEGPRAKDIPSAICGIDASGLALLKFTHCDIEGNQAIVSRIGYTGEFGYVFFTDPEVVGPLLERIRKVAPEAVLCGRAVQDVLRLEVRAFNLARDILRRETALEAGLHWMIDFRKPMFRGRDAIMAEKRRGRKRGLVAFVVLGDGGIDRGSPVRDEGREVGYVANHARSLTLDRTIGLAYLKQAYAWVGIDLAVEGNATRIQTVSAPFLITQSTKFAAG